MGGIDYRAWQRDSVHVGGRTVHVATKPGVVGHGAVDLASSLLAEHATVGAGDRVLHLNCGTGLFGASAAMRGAHVTFTDRNALSFEAATRTVAANGLEGAAVLLQQGIATIGQADVVGIRIPHDRLSQLHLIRDAFTALRVGGRCYIAGAVHEGIKPASRALQHRFGNALVLATAGGQRVVRATKVAERDDVPEEFAHPLLERDAFHIVPATVRAVALALHTRPGVFSWEHLDEATSILGNTMQIPDGARVLDLGCGSGALGTVAALTARAHVCMLDADSEAVRCAAQTASVAGATRVRTMASDIAEAVRNERFDVVLSNPPFHVGKITSLDVPMQFIEQAWEVLVPGGTLQLVANRTLPYEGAIRERFGHFVVLHDGARFKVLQAVKPAP